VAVNDAYDAVVPASHRQKGIAKGFFTDLWRYSAAADVIIARGSATNLAEFAIQRKACLIIPAPQLIWTVKNTEALARQGAIIELTEEQSEQELRLTAVVSELLDNPKKRTGLANKLGEYAHPDAAHQLAMLLLSK
jgi:UDP-N-acetylglucosamine:LPS N-acetylglucosamine transferase